MITLYISSEIQTTAEDIAMLLASGGSECQISQNCSAYKDKGGGSCKLETGYKIKLFGVASDDFKEKIWNILQPCLDLKCAHVKYSNEYRGCVLNWPGVFTKSNCEWEARVPATQPNTLADVSSETYRECHTCGETKARNQFSKTQSKKNHGERKCRACVEAQAH